jgi:putative oxidoreductase
MRASTKTRIVRPAGFGKPGELVRRIGGPVRTVLKGLNFAAPVIDLLVRLWVANVFWMSGLSKIQSISSTLLLFRYEYHVPLLPPAEAAYLSMFSELTFSVLLVLGLAGRFSAGVLFFVNFVAVISYPGLMTAGLQQHYLWGLLLLVLIFHGPGKLSLDHFIAFIARRFGFAKISRQA